GGDIGPDHRNLLDVVHGTNGSRKNLGLEVVIVIDGTDLGNELDPVDAHVVDAADKGRDEGCAGLCGQESLIGREAKRDIDHATLRTQGTAGPQSVPGERHLDGDVVRDRGKHLGFPHHAVIVGGGDFGGDRALDDLANLPGHVEDVAPRLEDQRGIGGDAVEHAKVVEFLDFLDVG